MQPAKAPTTAPPVPILSLVRMCWIHRFGIAAGWIVVTAISIFIVMKLPPVYTAEALILVDSQKIPERLVPSTVSNDIQDRLASLTQEILSSTRLQKIVDEFGLYRLKRKTHVREEILEMMRNDISWKLERGWTNNKPGAFRVGYAGPDAAIVAKVANRLANLYIEENLRTREVQAEGTSEFLETQVQDAKQKLDALEAAIGAYKMKHNGELPEQQGALDGAMVRLQLSQNGNHDALTRAQESKAMLESSLRLAETTLNMLTQRSSNNAAPAEVATAAEPAAGSSAPAAADPAPPTPKASEALEAQLDQLQVRYGSQHPDVKRLKLEIERVKATEAEESRLAVQKPAETPKQNATTVSTPVRRVLPKVNASASVEIGQAREHIQVLKSQIGLAEKEIENRKAEQDRLQRESSLYQAKLTGIPLREQELAMITRDYDSTKGLYRSLLEKRHSADMSTDMERRMKSERFTIIDPARVPEKPFKPNRPFYSFLGSACGLILSLGLAIGHEMRRDFFLGEWELPPAIGVLASVPRISMDEQGRLAVSGSGARWSPAVRLIAGLSILLCLLAVAAAKFHVKRWF